MAAPHRRRNRAYRGAGTHRPARAFRAVARCGALVAIARPPCRFRGLANRPPAVFRIGRWPAESHVDRWRRQAVLVDRTRNLARGAEVRSSRARTQGTHRACGAEEPDGTLAYLRT